MPRKAKHPKGERDRERIAWAELNSLAVGEAFGGRLDKTRIVHEEAVPIHDLNGQELFHRIPLRAEEGETQGRVETAEEGGAPGHVDMAAHPALGEPVLAVSTGDWWDADRLREEGLKAAQEAGIKGAQGAETRFVAYSFPKIGLQLLRKGEELALLELVSWDPVPGSRRGRRYEPPSNFERWSFLDEMPDDERERRENRFRERGRRWDESIQEGDMDIALIDRDAFIRHVGLEIREIALMWTRELHFSTRNTDHSVCYELRGQETNVWCVAASVQMLLDFYRYEYTQARLAQELGLGTLTSPNGLPYSRDGDVVTVIEGLSCSALSAHMNTSPTFGEFVTEINANRPLISFVPGHSRTVTGYYQSLITILGQPPFRGLLVYDPWPPNAGVITRWENYNVTTYRRTFTAELCRA